VEHGSRAVHHGAFIVPQSRPCSARRQLTPIGGAQVTGVFPFESPSHENNLTMTLQNLKLGNYRRLPADASPELVDLIARTFKADPGQRITLAGLASHPWLTDFEEHKVSESNLISIPGRVAADTQLLSPYATPLTSPPGAALLAERQRTRGHLRLGAAQRARRQRQAHHAAKLCAAAAAEQARQGGRERAGPADGRNAHRGG